ncbi:MFS transporter [Cupriavidus basilensis]|uniref:MFS transporter n=1 Tax=Cupriavidus basilensis TaxID=68895 RepID=A0ABT6AWA7_9BURK|nr:MFS transporter [Cupriavidus basilensis]MDF3836918.1 MFS transporter [Cupriavidus basilensis]
MAFHHPPPGQRHQAGDTRARWRHALHQALFGWLNLALTAPSVYLWLGLPLIMRQHGWSGTQIGLFQLAGLPAVFKFALAAPVERHRFAAGHYRGWAALLCLLLALLLCLIGRQPLLASRFELFALAFAAAMMATWADIPVNALAIKLLPASQRLRAGGLRSAALSMGAIVGGGLMLLAQARWGWRAPFWLMAGGLGLGVVALGFVREPAAPMPEPTGVANLPSGQWRGYFAQPGAMAWNGLLLLCFPFVGAAWFYLKPLLLDHGFAPAQIAWAVGVGGGLAAAGAGLAGARAIKAAGMARAIPGVAVLGLLALVALSAAVWLDAPPAGLLAAAMLVAVAMGATATLAFGLTMYFTRPGFDAVDYGTQASLFALSRLAVPLAGGLLIDSVGYRGMLLALTMSMALVTLLALRQRQRIAGIVSGRHLGEGARG